MDDSIPRYRYYFTRGILLVLALQIFNLSTAIDPLIARSAGESFDDIDSFCELLLEKFTGNDQLFAEQEEAGAEERGLSLLNITLDCPDPDAAHPVQLILFPAGNGARLVNPVREGLIPAPRSDISSPPPES